MKRKYALLLTCGLLIFSLLLIYFNYPINTYAINNLGSTVKVVGIEQENGESKFNTIFRLSEYQSLQVAFLEVEVTGKVIKDGEKLKLENGKVNMKTYGCNEIDHDFEQLDKYGYNSNRQYEQISGNKMVKETMPVGLAKLVVLNENIEVKNIIPNGNNINTKNKLLRENNNNEMVTLEYKSFDIFKVWLSIKAIPTDENTLSIEVF